ncbi:MAG: tail fiber domain-containing protein, partial [Candidatus Binatia bacterium]
SGAGASLTTGNYNIDIGSSGKAGESNTIRIGANQTATYIAGIQVGVGGSAVCINGEQLGLCASSARFKEQVRDIADASEQVFQLRPVRFQYKRDFDPSGQERFGLVAEEVARVNPDLVVYDRDGKPLTVRYDSVNAMLLNEVQKQARQIATLQKQVEELATLKAATAALQARVEALDSPQTVANRRSRHAQDARPAAF